MTVNREFIERWCEALESGDYEQTTGYLHVVDEFDGVKPGYCCVGVACVVAGIDEVPDLRDPEIGRFDGECASAPEPLRRLIDPDERWVNFGELYGMNDDDRKSFAEIAARLRARYLTPAEATS